MRIEITTTFDDLTKPEDEQRTEAGAKLTVSAERGAELVSLGIATEVDAPAVTPKRASRPRRVAKAKAAQPEPAPPLAELGQASATPLEPTDDHPAA